MGSFGAFAAIVALLAAARPLCELALRPKYTVHKEGAVLITGASSGIGLFACYDMAKKHPSVTFYCAVRKQTAGDEVVKNAPSKNVRTVVLDVTRQDQVEAAVETIQANGLPLIGVVNNAGMGNIGTIEHLTMDDFRYNMEVNYFGAIALTKAALPTLKKNKGRVINIGSTLGTVPTPARHSAYAATKFAMESWSDALRKEVAEFGVGVVLVKPGVVRTGFQDAVSFNKDYIERTALERKTYPHVVNEAFDAKFKDFTETNADTPDETIAAIEAAMFDPFPATRYISAKMGPMPSWLFCKIMWLVPDRVADLMQK
eukprot:TRINITY_DN1751_c0_g4_i1.p1 TRINITY_DN1751_c0_g4~~TRINITY_DN1751_c0_g4_i1.p1  ORF type:complete len:315 (-),score=50.77 TRINITY_DN1751_c0_g4_i1:27-971(-)